MEFRTPTQFDPNGINTQSVSIGGVGYNPTPLTFSYNGNGVGYYTSGSQPQSFVGSYNPGGYVTQPNNPYMGYNYNYTGQGAPIFDDRVRMADQFYYQLGYKPTVTGADGKPFQIGGPSYGNYYSSAWDMYNQRKQYEQEWLENQNQQREIRRRLTIMNRNFFGLDDGEEYFKQQEEIYQQQAAMQYQMQQMAQQYNYLVYISTLPNSLDPQYSNPARNEYISRWNKIYENRTSKYPENYTLYDFFNGGIASEMYMDAKIDEAIDRLKDMTRLYDQNGLRQQLAQSNPNYDPLTGIASGALNLNNTGGPRLNIDDMEITLPPHLSNSEYQKKRERFMATIFGNSTSMPISPPVPNTSSLGGGQNGIVNE